MMRPRGMKQFTVFGEPIQSGTGDLSWRGFISRNSMKGRRSSMR